MKDTMKKWWKAAKEKLPFIYTILGLFFAVLLMVGLGGTFGYLTGLIVGVVSLHSLLSLLITQEDLEDLDAGEQDVYEEVHEAKKKVLRYGGWVVFMLGLALYCLYGILWFAPASKLACVMTLVGLGFGIYFTADAMRLEMLKVGWWGVLIPANKSAYVVLEGSLWRIILNPVEHEMWLQLTLLARLINDQLGYERMVVLKPGGSGAYYFGLTKYPWRCWLKEPFYVYPGDGELPEVQPMRFGDVQVKNVNLLSRDQRPDDLHRAKVDEDSEIRYVVEAYASRDNIDTIVKLLLRFVVINHNKWVHATTFPGEDMYNEILNVVRRSLAGLYYFFDDPGTTADDLIMDPDQMQRLLLRHVLYELGILAYPRDWDLATQGAYDINDLSLPEPEILQPYITEENGQVVIKEMYREGSPAYKLFWRVGVLIVTFDVADVRPKSQELWDALQAIQTARAQGAAAYKKAVGEAKALFERKRQEAEGIKKVAAAISSPGGELAYNGETARILGGNTTGGITLISGGGGNLEGNVASAAATLAGMGAISLNRPTPPTPANPPANPPANRN